MKRKLLRYFLTATIAIAGVTTYGQSQKSYLISNDQQSFVNSLTNPQQSKSAPITIGNEQSFSFKLNVQKQTDTGLSLIGNVNNQQSSTFSFTRKNNKLEGTIILYNDKKAYALYSNEANGKVYVKESDINSILCVNYEKVSSNEAKTEHASVAKTLLQLESLPDAPGIIYLDFDGERVSNTSWLGGATIDAQSPNFTDQKITEIWKIMAEDFRPFNLNVTTRRDLFDAAPVNRRMMCIFTPTNDAAPEAGGVAYRNSFSSNVDNPCWIYNLGTRAAGETGSHEVGHTLGLSHDSAPNDEYYDGHGVWSPIMGWSVDREIGQWSSGEYATATNTQDDIAIISGNRNGVGFQNDDHGDLIDDATAIRVAPSGQVSADQNFGLISTRQDKDMFSFAIETGNVSFNFEPDPDYPNLNIQAKILNELGQEVAVSNPAGLSASINQNLNEGIYYIEIDGVGEGTVNNGYSDYASLGNYTISGSYPPGDDKNPPLSDFEITPNCLAIEFQNRSTNRITSYLWDFGDGTTSASESPAHTYSTKGRYTISLTTTNESGDNTISKTINIASPNQPIATDQQVCSGKSGIITATGNSDFKWYTTPTGGSSINSGATFETPILTSNRTYYVEGVISGCITETRTAVTVTVTESPQQPVVSNQRICKGESVTLSISGTSQYNWYDSPTGGTIIASGTTYTPPILEASRSYYVEGVLGNCTTSRIEVQVIVSPSPEQPVIGNQNICKGESVTLSLSGNSQYNWYNSPSGGTSIASGRIYETPALATTTTYYVEGVNGNCITTRTEVKINVSDNPETPSITVNNQKLMVPDLFSSYQWYRQGIAIDGANRSEHIPQQVGEYIVDVFNETGCHVTSKAFNVNQTFLNTGRENRTFIYYPNPVYDGDVLHIEGITADNYSLRIVNLRGQVIIDIPPTAQVDISELANGLYMILMNNKSIGKLIRE
ncbi:PKD domain-containing protein [Aquimarina sp. I32.4]|uniref:Ig-like domain-containing protein n=1 Tax=Aquimarina sp. I32.4 TaxID=2053903 RepID=UPI000CDE6759|nr:PKD domain-containing protein [Aquimarina sp. I32.4]